MSPQRGARERPRGVRVVCWRGSLTERVQGQALSVALEKPLKCLCFISWKMGVMRTPTYARQNEKRPPNLSDLKHGIDVCHALCPSCMAEGLCWLITLTREP